MASAVGESNRTRRKNPTGWKRVPHLFNNPQNDAKRVSRYPVYRQPHPRRPKTAEYLQQAARIHTCHNVIANHTPSPGDAPLDNVGRPHLHNVQPAFQKESNYDNLPRNPGQEQHRDPKPNQLVDDELSAVFLTEQSIAAVVYPHAERRGRCDNNQMNRRAKRREQEKRRNPRHRHRHGSGSGKITQVATGTDRDDPLGPPRSRLVLIRRVRRLPSRLTHCVVCHPTIILS